MLGGDKNEGKSSRMSSIFQAPSNSPAHPMYMCNRDLLIRRYFFQGLEHRLIVCFLLPYFVIIYMELQSREATEG